jgi:hypothetical protein
MSKRSKIGWLVTALIAIAATGSEAKVLRSSSGALTVFVFKGADELRRFKALKASTTEAIQPLLACEAPQGSNVEVLGSGHRTAFVKIVDGLAFGCQGTVPIDYVQNR